jgi:hypothetical protein
MKAHFAPCEGCGRHIRVSEDICPFCDASTSPTFRARAAAAGPNKRLSRAALYMFGAASATAVAGCSSSESTTPVYGAPADTNFLEASGDTADAGADTASAVDADTATPDTSVDDSSKADTADGGAAPAYGLPPDTAP